MHSNDSFWSHIGTLAVLVGVVWLYVRAYVSLLRTEKNTKATAEHLSTIVENSRRRAAGVAFFLVLLGAGTAQAGQLLEDQHDAAARKYFQCTTTRWSEKDLMATWRYLRPEMTRVGLSSQQAQALVVKIGFAATGADETIWEMRRDFLVILGNTPDNGAPESMKTKLSADYRNYCPKGVKK